MITILRLIVKIQIEWLINIEIIILYMKNTEQRLCLIKIYNL